MKLIKDAFISTVIFVGVMLIFDIPFPVLRDSAALGIFATVGSFYVVSSAVAILALLIGLIGGVVIGALASDNQDSAKIGGCLGVLIGFLIAYAFEFWFLRNAHSWSWSNWFPAFSGLQTTAILAGSLILGVMTHDSKKKES